MAAKEQSHLGVEFRKAQPKLRVIANGDERVNAARALQCGAVAVTGTRVAAPPPEEIISTEEQKVAKKGKQRSLAENISVNVFVQTDQFSNPFGLEELLFNGAAGKNTKASNTGKKTAGSAETAQNGNLVTVQVRLKDLPALLANPNVVRVDLAENLKVPNPTTQKSEAPPELKVFQGESRHKYGKDVLIGIIDVGGFDFSHPDFLDEKGETRFICIWDQGGKGRPSPYKGDNKTYDYGSEILQRHMNAAIKASKAPESMNLSAYELEPQSQMTPGSHGTHVASIAAGNTGVARNALIAGVLVGAPKNEIDSKAEDKEKIYKERRSSFYDSTQIVHAVNYLIQQSIELMMPLSINISLGTNGHAHDGSSPVSRWIDNWLGTMPNIAVTVAAGNAGQESAKTANDLGYVFGRIHTSGKIASRGLTSDIEWQVIGDGDKDGYNFGDMSENELEIWYSAQDSFSVQVKPPGGKWTEIVEELEYIENMQMENGAFLSIYNETYHAANGLNCISIYLSPNLLSTPPKGSSAGMWKVRLHGREIRDGRYHGWIERDDPRVMQTEDGLEVRCLPSFFSQISNVDNSSVNSLACGQRIISVANYHELEEAINITSSQGPTRDGRFKPDIAAPGTNIVAAKGFSDDEEKWIAMSGTSMASPFVAGLAALMLRMRKGLTAAQIEGIIRSTAQPLPGGTYEWIDSAGFGRIAPNECIAKTAVIGRRKDLSK